MITDGLRALLMEREGYSTKLFEFISDAHTPKNVMLIGTKHGARPYLQEKIDAAKRFFGIGKHYLESQL
jgi:hypothetical protein